MKSLLASAIAITSVISTCRADENLPIGPRTSAETASSPASTIKTEVSTYMGVATSILPPVLREHLGLEKGIGLKIDHVEPGSPADKAGVKINDILIKLDDQQIINAHQLTVLVRMKKVGDTVTLHLISQGKPTQLVVSLGQKELPTIEAPMGIVIPDEMQNQNPIPRTGDGRASSVINHTDAEHSITINTHDDQRDIIIKDRQNNEIYSGPFNTSEDLKKIPAELQKKVELIQKAAGNMKFFNENPPDSINRGGAGSM